MYIGCVWNKANLLFTPECHPQDISWYICKYSKIWPKMQTTCNNGFSTCAFLLFPLRPGISGFSTLPYITDAPVQETLMCGALGCPSGTCRDTRTDQYAFASCPCTSPEAKPATRIQLGSSRQLIPPKWVGRDLVTKAPQGVVALGTIRWG